MSVKYGKGRRTLHPCRVPGLLLSVRYPYVSPHGPILLMKKLRPRKAKSLAKLQSWKEVELGFEPRWPCPKATSSPHCPPPAPTASWCH